VDARACAALSHFIRIEINWIGFRRERTNSLVAAFLLSFFGRFPRAVPDQSEYLGGLVPIFPLHRAHPAAHQRTRGNRWCCRLVGWPSYPREPILADSGRRFLPGVRWINSQSTSFHGAWSRDSPCLEADMLKLDSAPTFSRAEICVSLESRRCSQGRPPAVCCNGHDDEDIEYGKEYVHTAEKALEEERKLYPAEHAEIWPHWGEGVPTKLRSKAWSPAFTIGTVHHRARLGSLRLELEWSKAHLLSALRGNYGLLPSGKYTNEWNGVYRIFVPDKTIGRLGGEDPTGTLYIGRAGSERGWSILRTRLMQVAKGEHRAVRGWTTSRSVQQKYPWECLAVQWAYTAHRLNYRGDSVPGAKLTETLLLRCYDDSFGEYPPMNQEG